MDSERESPFNLQEFLEDVDFPADKTDLISYAAQLEVDQDMLDALDRLPDQEYYSAEEVLQAVGVE